MRIVVCPDKFAGTLSAVQAAHAICDGWLRVRPGDRVRSIPLADGGPGFVDVLHANLGGDLRQTRVRDPLGRTVRARWLAHGAAAYIEAAAANGLHLLSPAETDPVRASSYGVGELIAAAAGSSPIVVGLGGSATNDGGLGAVEALGDRPVPDLVLATDVDAPLLGPQGATYGFARQKGATEQQLPVLEERMRQWASRAPDLVDAPGAGAAGGLGFGLMTLGGRRESGIELVMRVVGLESACRDADLVITGEGSFDWQSMRGKVVSGVARVAPRVLVLAGRVSTDALPARSLVEFAGQRSVTEPMTALSDLAADAARAW